MGTADADNDMYINISAKFKFLLMNLQSIQNPFSTIFMVLCNLLLKTEKFTNKMFHDVAANF